MAKSRGSAAGGKRGRDAAAEGPPDSASKPVSFENALEQLEATVAQLEEGEMPLEEALELFESGVKLSRQCSTTLEEAERRIEILVADRGEAGELESIPFLSEDLSDDETGEDGNGEQDDDGLEG